MGGAAVLDWMVQDGERLENCRHDHPLSVLGPQPGDQGWTVRVWMPEAQKAVSYTHLPLPTILLV